MLYVHSAKYPHMRDTQVRDFTVYCYSALCFFSFSPWCSTLNTLLLSCSLLRILDNLLCIFPRVLAEISDNRLSSMIQKCWRTLHWSASRRNSTNSVNLSASSSFPQSSVFWLYHSRAVFRWKDERRENVGSCLRIVLTTLNKSWRHPWSLFMSLRRDFCAKVYDLTHVVSRSAPAEKWIYKVTIAISITILKQGQCILWISQPQKTIQVKRF